MNNRTEWMNHLPDGKDVNYTEDTKTRFLDRKTAFWVVMGFGVCIDFIIAIFCSAVRNYDAVYQFEPWLIFAIDLVFLGFSIFVSFRQNGAKIGFSIYTLMSSIVTIVTLALAFSHRGVVVMSAWAAVVLVFFQIAKALAVGWAIFILPKYYWNKRKYIHWQMMYAVSLFVCIGFLVFNGFLGFMGQNIAVADKEATLTFCEDENGDFIVAGTLDNGSIINVPQSFNGRNVAGIEAAVLNNTKIKLVLIKNENFKICNVNKLTDMNPDLRVEINKAGLNAIREELFYQLRGNASLFGERLINTIVPGDLAADETFYHYTYGGETPRDIVYIPTVFEKKGNFNVAAAKEAYKNMGEYFAHTGLRSQKDLKWCYEHNDGYILDEGNITIGENVVTVPFSRVYYLKSLNGNDTKWTTTVQSQYISTADLKTYFNELPTRNGFDVVWQAEDSQIESDAEFENFFATRGGQSVSVFPRWAVQVPKITQYAADRNITYGENTAVEINADSVLPCTFRLYRESNLIETKTTGNFALNGYKPMQSGKYRIRITASDPEITSLTSEAAISEFEFVINKKTLHLEWSLPDNEVYNKTEKKIFCAYDENDIVSTADEIELFQSLDSVINAADYNVSAWLEGECDNLYQLDEKANMQFSVLPKPVALGWQTLSEEELIYDKKEKSVEAQVLNLIEGDDCSVIVDITSTNRFGAGEVVYSAVLLSNTNYTLENGEDVRNTYVITPLVINFDWQIPDDLVYNAEEKIATVIPYNIIAGDDCGIKTEHDGDNISAGAVNYTASGLLGVESENYVLPQDGLAVSFEILKRQALLKWDELTEDDLIYSGTEKEVGAVVENLCGEDVCNVNVEIFSTNKYRVGEVGYRAVSLVNENYCLTDGSGLEIRYNITPLPIIVDWQIPTEEELVYDGTAKTATAVISNLAEGDDCAIITSNTPNVFVGTVEFQCNMLTGEDSYNYILPSGIIKSFNITERTVSIVWMTPEENSLIYDGTEKVSTIALGNLIEGDECGVFVSNSDNVSAGKVTYIAEYLYGASFMNYQLPEEHAVSYEIRRRTAEIEWTTPTGAVYNKTGKEAQAAFLNLVAGDDCNFVIEHTDNVSAGIVNYSIVDLQGEKSGNYKLPETDDVSTSFKIEKKDAVLSWVNLTEAQRVYRGSVLDVTATVTNLEDGDVCIVELKITSDNKIEVGSVSYEAVNLTNGNYKLTSESHTEYSYTIVQRQIEFVWIVPTGENLIYNAREKVAVPRFDNLVAGDDCVINTEHTPNVDAGDVEYGITGISGEKSRNYYLPTENLTTSFNIEQRTAVISWTVFGAGELIYNKQAKTVKAVVSNLQGSDKCETTVVRTSANERDAGDIEYEVKELSNLNYKITQYSNAGKTYTILPLEIVLEWTLPINPEYDGTEKSASVAFKNLIDGDDCTLVVEHGDNVSAGQVEYRLTKLSGAQSGNYKLPTLGLRRSFTINKRTVTPVWTTPTNLNYDGNVKTATVKFTNLVGSDECIPVVSNSDNRNAGEVVYTLYDLDGSKKDNYKLPITGLTSKFTIVPKEAELTWSYPSNLIYDGNEKTATVTIANKVTGDACNVVLSHNDNINAGEVVYTATGFSGTHQGNYTLPTDKSIKFNIAPLAVTVNWQLPTGAVYDGTQKTATATIANKIAGDDCNLILAHSNNVNAGTATCEITGLSGSKKGNYKLDTTTQKSNSFTIAKRDVVLQWAQLSANQLIYDGYEKAVTAIVSNKVTGDNCTVGVQIISANRKNAGEVVYKAVSLTNGDNYALPTGSQAEHTYKITKRVITLSWTNPTSLIYDGAAKTASAQIENLVAGDSCFLVLKHENNVNAGKATSKVTSISGDDSGNYALPTSVQHEFTIVAKPVTVQWSLNDDDIYDGAEKTVTANAVGVLSSDECTVYFTIVSANKYEVGEVKYSATGLSNPNYTLNENSNSEYKITIKKANRSGITLTMDSWTEGESAKNPSVSGYNEQVTFEYCKKGSSVYSSVKPTEVGEYTVRMTIAADKNYNEFVASKSFAIYAQQAGGNE